VHDNQRRPTCEKYDFPCAIFFQPVTRQRKLVTPFLNQRQAVDSPEHNMKRIKSQISPAAARRKAIFFDDARR